MLNGDVAAELARVRWEPGDNILTYGFGPVAPALMEEGREGTVSKLELIATRPLGSGVVMFSYRPECSTGHCGCPPARGDEK